MSHTNNLPPAFLAVMLTASLVYLYTGCPNLFERRHVILGFYFKAKTGNVPGLYGRSVLCIYEFPRLCKQE